MDGCIVGDFATLFLSLACLWFIVKFGMHKVDFNMLLNVYCQIFVLHDLEMHGNWVDDEYSTPMMALAKYTTLKMGL